MRRLLFLPVVFSLAVFLSAVFSCGKNDASSNAGRALDAASAESGGEGAPEVPSLSAAGYGFALRVDTGFYTLENDTGAETDALKWASSIPLGEKVFVLEEGRKAVYQGTAYVFAKIARDTGDEGFVIASNLAVGGGLGVVTEEKANLYRTPKSVDVMSSVLPYKTVLAYFPETERDGFVEFKAYDAVGKTLRRNFIKLSAFSTREADVQSSILLQTAQSLDPSKNQVRIEALLKDALLEYPDSVFAAEIDALANPNASVRIDVRPGAQASLTVNDDDVNVRDLPDAVAGRVLGRLDLDTEVTVSEETVDTYVVDGQSDRWYHITSPLDGWVFGSFLTENR
jgi:hypothetical protein